MKKNIKETIKGLAPETIAAVASVFVFIAAVIPIIILFPTAALVDMGGELHMMAKGLVTGAVSLALTVFTHFIGIKTHWIYAMLSGEKHDPENKLPSYREDFRNPDSLPKIVRLVLFTFSFFAVWIIWFNCLTPDAVVLQSLN